MLKLGLLLSSDVPFFIHEKKTLASCRGEKFIFSSYSDVFESKAIIVIKPNEHVSAVKVFEFEWLTKRNNEGKMCDLDIQRLIQSGENDFEKIIFRLYPNIYEVANRLSDYLQVHLTGA